MTDILYPTKTRRFMSEVAGMRRYHSHPARAVSAARGGVLWVAVSKGWSCNPDRVWPSFSLSPKGGCRRTKQSRHSIWCPSLQIG